MYPRQFITHTSHISPPHPFVNDYNRLQTANYNIECNFRAVLDKFRKPALARTYPRDPRLPAPPAEIRVPGSIPLYNNQVTRNNPSFHTTCMHPFLQWAPPISPIPSLCCYWFGKPPRAPPNLTLYSTKRKGHHQFFSKARFYEIGSRKAASFAEASAAERSRKTVNAPPPPHHTPPPHSAAVPRSYRYPPSSRSAPYARSSAHRTAPGSGCSY